jgi:hypothetical protein
MLGRVVVTLSVIGTLMASGAAEAQIQETEFRAADGTTYQVLVATNLGGGAENIRVTTVAGSVAGAGSCAATGNASGDPTSAIGGVLPPGMNLHPYSQIRRTGIISGVDVSVLNFTGTFGGRVRIGDPMGTVTYVCGAAFDCTGLMASEVQTLYNLDSALGGVPAACQADGLNAQCDGTNLRNTYAFGVAATGTNPPICNNPTTAVTVNSTVCATQPADGFTLGNNQAIVFVYNSGLGSSGFAIAVGGFGISTDTVNNPNCPNPNSIVSATGDNDSQPAPPPPTSTPTNTPTNTATATATATNTATHTFTATNTATPTNTATATATRTNTPTATNTPPPTNTRPPIPVVPSPTSPAGLVMIIGLGGGLLWALRRMARVR